MTEMMWRKTVSRVAEQQKREKSDGLNIVLVLSEAVIVIEKSSESSKGM